MKSVGQVLIAVAILLGFMTLIIWVFITQGQVMGWLSIILTLVVIGVILIKIEQQYALTNHPAKDINISNMEDKDIMSELKLEYRNNIVYFNGLKINAYTAEGMRFISNLLKKGLYEIGKELGNISNSK